MVYPREILINKNAQVFYGNFRLEAIIYILFMIKHGKFWLGSKSLLVRMKNYKVGFFNVKCQFVGCQPAIRILLLIVDYCLKIFQIFSAYKILVSFAKR